MRIGLYEDNAGGLALTRDDDGRLWPDLQFSENTFAEDAAIWADDIYAMQQEPIDNQDDLAYMEHIADWIDGRITVYTHPGVAARIYLGVTQEHVEDWAGAYPQQLPPITDTTPA
jgi:hypothetical protein